MFNYGSNGYSLSDIAAVTDSNRDGNDFGGNGAVPADGTAGPISVALAIDGEPINTTTMIFTPAAVSTYGNVFGAIFIDIPRGCCGRVSVRNTSTAAISVQNANLIIERVA